MKAQIREWICRYMKAYAEGENIATAWGEPLVGFADAYHPYIQRLPQLIGASHGLPQQVLSDASIVIAYYVPFTRELAKTNDRKDVLASPDWARAYEETNAMFNKLNQYLIDCLQEAGYTGAVSPKAGTFNQQTLISDWSQRHFAYAAGLGTFGINNMLITKSGCCGRYSTIVTDLAVEPDQPREGELCLYKQKGTCGICMKHCPAGAITGTAYDRHKCYGILQKNAEVYRDFGSSYMDESGKAANSAGSEVCGKCVTQSPCAFWRLTG